MFKIQTLNAISDIIHAHLSAEQYLIAKEEPVPDGILVRSADMHSLELPDSLLAIARAGAGTNNVPIERCNKQGIVVFNTPGANANAVAELVVCGLMLGSRNIVGGIEWVKTLRGKGEDVPKLVEKGKGEFVGPEVRGKILGVVGLGAIGAIVANTAELGLGMDVIGFDPFISVESAWALSSTIRRCTTQDALYAQADYITLHVPLGDKTRGLVDAAALSRMKDGVHLLNFSRAELVDTAAIAAALESGKVASYVTDFPTEALIGVKNAVVIPHLGASTPESEENCASMAAKQLKDYLEFGQIKNSVNFPELQLNSCTGHRILVIHENVPAMVSAISSAIADKGINIDNMLNKSRKEMAVTVLETDDHPPEALIGEIRALPGVIRVRTFEPNCV
ncbi:MAG: phosphoglycerate dehydrogenase [Candidatus Limiplasma sp.]|nr:phosphoglycerate dehydrogenase [Candidatus Limiplasma sp.]MEA5145129.1 phosphoglycerate dehydrogenase [Candidatus Limiplasma sp.]